MGISGPFEITRNTCPACDGTGVHETRVEDERSYSVASSVCWLCEGDRVVGPEKMAEYAKVCERFTA